MRVTIDVSGIRRTTIFEFAIRFVMGGIVTAIAGIIADKFGPAAGGLFLAFPAIFPASTTLVEKHEIEKKQAAGVRGSIRGRTAAGLDAAGAAMGAIGLFGFALLAENVDGKYGPWIVLLGATVLWFTIAGLMWRLRKSRVLKWLKLIISRQSERPN